MCKSCDAVTINGMVCHERGCPDAWKDYTVTCKWCGSKFSPDERYQLFCDTSCRNAFNGYPDEETDEEL